MNKQSVSLKIIGVLALGAALASTSAFAQSPGRSANDGGMVTATGSAPRVVTSQKPTASAQPSRPANDGGMVIVTGDEVPSARASATPSAPAKPGRAANDGGIVQ